MVNKNLIFIKLGGSLITEKDVPNSARLDVINGLAQTIQQISVKCPQYKFVLGHGSGSFGHHAAYKYSTQDGVYNHSQWLGFLDVWQAAHKLNQIIINAFAEVGLPIISFPPSACLTTQNKQIKNWDLKPITSALEAGFMPLVMGDVVFDSQLGGTILSTEELFYHLALELKPATILLAGIENGVYADFPECLQLIPRITKANFELINQDINESISIDVTGGMRSKVKIMMALSKKVPGLQTRIFTALDPKNIELAIEGDEIGTLISDSE